MTEQATEYECPICGQPLTIVMSALRGYYAECKALNGCGLRTGRYDYEFVNLENVLEDSEYQKTARERDKLEKELKGIHESYQSQLAKVPYHEGTIRHLKQALKNMELLVEQKRKECYQLKDEIAQLKTGRTDPGWYQCNDGIYTFITDDDDKMHKIIENYVLMNKTLTALEYLPNGVLKPDNKETTEREENDEPL